RRLVVAFTVDVLLSLLPAFAARRVRCTLLPLVALWRSRTGLRTAGIGLALLVPHDRSLLERACVCSRLPRAGLGTVEAFWSAGPPRRSRLGPEVGVGAVVAPVSRAVLRGARGVHAVAVETASSGCQGS